MEEISITFNLRSILLVSCSIEVAWLTILFLIYIPTAKETLEIYPDNWKYILCNILMKFITPGIYAIIFCSIRKKKEIALKVMTWIDSIYFLFRSGFWLKDAFTNRVDAITTIQLFFEVIVIVILFIYLYLRKKQPITQNPASGHTDQPLIELNGNLI